MGTLKGQAFTASGTFTVPANVSSVFVTMVGGGGAGGSGVALAGGAAAGGGSGEMCISRQVKVTPGASITVTIGAAGVPNAVDSYAPSGNGGTTSFGSDVFCAGGFGGSTANDVGPPVSVIFQACDGGGLMGAKQYDGKEGYQGVPGAAESATFFGGSSGSGRYSNMGPPNTGTTGGGYAFNSGGPGGVGYVTPGWTPGDYAARGGSGGASSQWGIGGAGGDANDLTQTYPTPATSAGSYGAGAGGVGGWDTDEEGGIPAGGYCLVQWVG